MTPPRPDAFPRPSAAGFRGMCVRGCVHPVLRTQRLRARQAPPSAPFGSSPPRPAHTGQAAHDLVPGRAVPEGHRQKQVLILRDMVRGRRHRHGRARRRRLGTWRGHVHGRHALTFRPGFDGTPGARRPDANHRPARVRRGGAPPCVGQLMATDPKQLALACVADRSLRAHIHERVSLTPPLAFCHTRFLTLRIRVHKRPWG
jgi:hypothetical protein